MINGRQRVLFNARNLRIGGGVQVAASLIDEIHRIEHEPTVSERFPWLQAMHYEVSPEVMRNVAHAEYLAQRARVTTVSGEKPMRLKTTSRRDFDVEFTVFGPRYGFRRARRTVTGIADVTSVYPWPPGVEPGTLSAQMRRWIRGVVARRMFYREDHLISESGSLAAIFCSRTGYASTNISIVPNVPNRLVTAPSSTDTMATDFGQFRAKGELLLAYVARKYPHKNHSILPEVARELALRGVKCRFVLTLTEEEWRLAPRALRDVGVNAGILQVGQLRNLYDSVDGVIFPSLLESCSAAPLEALATNGLLFAADRSFIKEFCGDLAVYFDPLSASSMADRICSTLRDPERVASLRQAGQSAAFLRRTAQDRAIETLGVIDRILSEVTAC